MSNLVPKLDPRPTSRAIRLLSLVLPGVRTVTAQIEPYTAWWDAQNQRSAGTEGPLLVAVGDSTAIGIGASAPDRSYVGLLRGRLQAHRGPDAAGNPWRVVNLGLSGARVADALERQMPVVAQLQADVVVCCIGTNDLVWGRETTGLRDNLRRLVEALPDGSVVGSLGGGSARSRMVNRALRRAAAERSLPLVDTWSEPAPEGRERLAVDRFHPNDLGYELMAVPFYRALGLPDDFEADVAPPLDGHR